MMLVRNTAFTGIAPGNPPLSSRGRHQGRQSRDAQRSLPVQKFSASAAPCKSPSVAYAVSPSISQRPAIRGSQGVSRLKSVETDYHVGQESQEVPHHLQGMTRVKFSVHRDMEFGQNIVLVGGHPMLGDWDVNEGVPLDWVEGNRWEVEMELPHYELIAYKFVVRCGWHDSAHTIWAGGPNSLLATNSSSSMEMEENWVSQEDWWCGDDQPAALASTHAAQIYHETFPKHRPGRDTEDVQVPAWAENAIFYAIYPLGAFKAPFANDGVSEPVPRLAEIRKQYDHLVNLGVDVVYFSPLFESETHGYDTVDYFKIDRRLGDIQLFKEIVNELHQRGIRVILDGVFNHTGRGHHAFKDMSEKGPGLSEYANWYNIGAAPDSFEGWCIVDFEGRDSGFWAGSGFAYDCWEGHAQLPQLNHSEPRVREYIFEVARFWLQDVGVDGWRLDVAHEMSPDFWREFRQVCNAVKPDCLLVGEMIHGNYRGWVGNDRLHSGTNYQLSRAIWSSLVESNYDELYTAIQRENKLYDGMTLLNFVSNHDVIRLASVLTKKEHYTLATAALLLLPGIPCFYYGDEYGVEGRPGDGVDVHSGGDDALRPAMLNPNDPLSWPAGGQDRLETTRKLVKLKQKSPAFTRGKMDVEGIEYGNQYFAFCRVAEGEQVGVVVFNSSDHPVDPWPEVSVPLPDDAIMTDVWSDEEVDEDGYIGPATFKVYAGKVYVGPMEPNSVRVLMYTYGEAPPVKRKVVAKSAATSPVTQPGAGSASYGAPGSFGDASTAPLYPTGEPSWSGGSGNGTWPSGTESENPLGPGSGQL